MENRKLTVSFGLLALVTLHAFMIRVPLPSIEQRPLPMQSFCFDTIEQSLARPAASPVNVQARDELKKADPVPAKNTEVKQQTKAGDRTIKRFNLDLFVTTDAQSKQLLDWFRCHPDLSRVASRCNFQVYATGDALYKERYQQWVPPSAFPAIMLTRSDGGHCYVASQGDIPNDPTQLLAEIKTNTEASIRASQLAALPPAQASTTNPSSSNPNCPDGKCPPKPDRDRPFFPDRDDGSLLFPVREPAPFELVQTFFRQSGIGLESVALLILAVVVVIAILRQR
jgi:hypothetical protein